MCGPDDGGASPESEAILVTSSRSQRHCCSVKHEGKHVGVLNAVSTGLEMREVQLREMLVVG